ncbi:hypothetical protein ABY44_11585, partial [Burkholderia sp. ZZQ-2]|uniref:hypothetical protein n=1 Tax=Burkholderia sp. ZZQ-2 TaxID=1661766 RepID=UPI003D6DB2E1
VRARTGTGVALFLATRTRRQAGDQDAGEDGSRYVTKGISLHDTSADVGGWNPSARNPRASPSIPPIHFSNDAQPNI